MIKVNINNYFEKLRALPDKQKKIILWAIVVVLGIIMLFFWFDSAAKRISKLGEGLKTIELPQAEIQTPAVETEQKDETADWKTYTNNQYGFQIKYPNDWFIKEDLANKKFLISNRKPSYPVLILQILNKNYLESLANEEKVLNELQKKSPEQPIGEINDITFAGTSAKEFLYYSPIGSIDQTIITSKGDLTINISSYKNSALDPILSTFKFIE